MSRKRRGTQSTMAAVRQGTPGVLSAYTAAEHRRRLENIRLCEQSIATCLRKHLVTSYIPGHCVYALKGRDFMPTEADDRELRKLRDAGISLIQVWSPWWDNCWGGKPMYRSANAEGFRRLIDLVHSHGMKIIPYTSTNFFERTDPNFSPAWATEETYDLVEHNYHLAHCSPASPGWRAHVLGPMMRIMDEFDVDGLYNDMGYHRPSDFVAWGKYYHPEPKVAEDEVLAFQESATHDGAAQDMVALIYAEVKRRGGIYKLHKEGCDRLHGPLKVYDYVWVGEAVWDIDFLRRRTKDYDPYVVPEFSRHYSLANEEELYLNSIPYMQFPLARTARTGGSFENRALHGRWLRLYLSMVEEGTWAWIEGSSSRVFAGQLPSEVVASVFANRELYIVLANYGHSPARVMTTDRFVRADSQSARGSRQWRLDARSLLVLRRNEASGKE